MATVHENQILTIFMLFLGGHYHCVKVSSDSVTVRGMGLWEFSGALRELMIRCKVACANREDLNQSVHPHSLVIVLPEETLIL